MLGYSEWLDGTDEWRSKKGNPVVEAMRSFCAAWWGSLELRFQNTCKAKDLAALIEDDPAALGINGSTHQLITKLGYKLREMVGRTDLAPYRVRDAGMRSGSRTYRIERVDKPKESQE